jgi:hypothetical protein
MTIDQTFMQSSGHVENSSALEENFAPMSPETDGQHTIHDLLPPLAALDHVRRTANQDDGGRNGVKDGWC